MSLLSRIKAIGHKPTQKVSQFICQHEWEFRVEKGEEEHGLDPSKRYCTKCNKCQHGFYHRFGDIRVEWVDSNKLPQNS